MGKLCFFKCCVVSEVCEVEIFKERNSMIFAGSELSQGYHNKVP